MRKGINAMEGWMTEKRGASGVTSRTFPTLTHQPCFCFLCQPEEASFRKHSSQDTRYILTLDLGCVKGTDHFLDGVPLKSFAYEAHGRLPHGTAACSYIRIDPQVL